MRNIVLCFDYYFTLVELDPPFERINIWLEEHISNSFPCIDTKRFIGKFVRNRAVLSTSGCFYTGIALLVESLAITCDFFKVPCFHDPFKKFVEELFIAPSIYPDAHSVIEKLRQNYMVGLLTNADNHILFKSIDKHNFMFDFIITSEDARANKPQKEIFAYALEKLGKNADDTVMIGDSQVDDIMGAGCAGMKTVWVNRNNELLKEGIKPPLFQVDNLSGLLHNL